VFTAVILEHSGLLGYVVWIMMLSLQDSNTLQLGVGRGLLVFRCFVESVFCQQFCQGNGSCGACHKIRFGSQTQHYLICSDTVSTCRDQSAVVAFVADAVGTSSQ